MAFLEKSRIFLMKGLKLHSQNTANESEVANLPYEGIGTAAPPAVKAGGVRLDRAHAKKQEAGITAPRQEPIRKISQIRPIAPSIVFFFYRFISARYGGWC